MNKVETLKEFSIKDIEKGEVLGSGSFETTFIANLFQSSCMRVTTKFQNFLKTRKVWVALYMKILLALKQYYYKLSMFMMELVVFDFNVFGTDRKLTTLEDLLRYCDNFMFKKIENILLSAATDIVKGLKYLHSKEVVHHDLKPSNVLISNHHYRNLVTMEERNKVFQDRPIICKLCDFGESRS